MSTARHSHVLFVARAVRHPGTSENEGEIFPTHHCVFFLSTAQLCDGNNTTCLIDKIIFQIETGDSSTREIRGDAAWLGIPIDLTSHLL